MRNADEVEQGPSAPVSLSNRRETSPFFGVDRISLSFPLRSWESDPSAWSRVSVSNPGTKGAASTLGASLSLNDHCKVFVSGNKLGSPIT